MPLTISIHLPIHGHGPLGVCTMYVVGGCVLTQTIKGYQYQPAHKFQLGILILP